MGKIDNEFIPDCRQCSVCSIEQGVRGYIVRLSEPFTFEYAPQRLDYVEMCDLVRIELRRGLSLGTFSYTSISRANADKKARNVLSLASFPEALLPGFLGFLHALPALLDGFANRFFVQAVHYWAFAHVLDVFPNLQFLLTRSVSPKHLQIQVSFPFASRHPLISDPVISKELRGKAYGMYGSCQHGNLFPIPDVAPLSIGKL